MTNKLRLGVNIDHVATIRNARGGTHPDPLRAAQAAAKAGADGITAHLREDRRHITDDDIDRLIAELWGCGSCGPRSSSNRTEASIDSCSASLNRFHQSPNSFVYSTSQATAV